MKYARVARVLGRRVRAGFARRGEGAVRRAAAGPRVPLHLRRNGDRLGRLLRQVEVRFGHVHAVGAGRQGGQGQASTGHGRRVRSRSAPRRSAPTGTRRSRSATSSSRSTSRSRTRRPRRRNGGIMIRTPEVRYSCPGANGAPANCSTANGNAAILALKPTGLQLRRLPGRHQPGGRQPAVHADDAGRVADVHVGRLDRPVPARGRPTPAATARATRPRASMTSTAPTTCR